MPERLLAQTSHLGGQTVRIRLSSTIRPGVYMHIRDRWLPLAQQVQAKMVQCVNFFEIRCLRHLPADPRFAQARDNIPQVDEGDPDPTEVDLDGLSDRWVQSGYEIVITD